MEGLERNGRIVGGLPGDLEPHCPGFERWIAGENGNIRGSSHVYLNGEENVQVLKRSGPPLKKDGVLFTVLEMPGGHTDAS